MDLLILAGLQVLIGLALVLLVRAWFRRYKLKIGISMDHLRAEVNTLEMRLRAATDELQEQRRVAAGSGVSPASYENEERAYEAVWATLLTLRQAVAPLYAAMTHGHPDASDEMSESQRMDAVATAYNAFLERFEVDRPFYDEEVYEQLRKLQGLVQGKKAVSPRFDVLVDGYWKRTTTNAGAIVRQIDAVGEAIRVRRRSFLGS